MEFCTLVNAFAMSESIPLNMWRIQAKLLGVVHRADHDTAPTFLIANEEESTTCHSSKDFVVLRLQLFKGSFSAQCAARHANVILTMN
jgi:hypothetical protein